MKIEFILIGVIALVFLTDFIFKRRKKGLIIPKQKIVSSKKKKFVLIISLFSAIASGLLIYIYNPFFIFNENNISIIDFIKYERFYEGDVLEKNINNKLTFISKKTMEPITGIIYSKYMILGVAINGKANGTFTGLGIIENYSNGKLNGLRKVWASRNKKTLRIDSNYKNGLLNGSYKEWNNQGQLLKEANYKNGHPNGSYKEWSNKGQLLKDENYINGVLNGSYLKYYGDKVEVIGNYLNGKKNGSWSVLHLNKDKEITLNFGSGLFESGENLNEVGFYFTRSKFFRSGKVSYERLTRIALERNITLSKLISDNEIEILFYGVDLTDLFY